MSVEKKIACEPEPSGHSPESLQKKLGYSFKNLRLLKEALTHPTFAHEHPTPDLSDNQRLEFLGDAVLNLVVGHLLMQHYPKAREGELTRMRANLVSEAGLSTLARDLGLGPHIRLGRGEQASHGQKKRSILADAMEALMAAVYLDSGGDKAFRVIERLFSPLLGHAPADPKTDLQELAQKKYGVVPNYEVVAESGPDHDKTFVVKLSLNELFTTGEGKSKKVAEKNAAVNALKILSENAR